MPIEVLYIVWLFHFLIKPVVCEKWIGLAKAIHMSKKHTTILYLVLFKMTMSVLKQPCWIPPLKFKQQMHYAPIVYLRFPWLWCLIWVLLWPEIRLLWPWQGLVLLCHDASIPPGACLLPGPKTICCKLRYGLFRLMCCLRTWCDWVSIHTTTLKLPASWPQTPIVTASVQDKGKKKCHGTGLCLGQDAFFMLPDFNPQSVLREEKIRDLKHRAPLLSFI